MCPAYSLAVCNKPYDNNPHLESKQIAHERARATKSPIIVSQVLRYNISNGGRNMVTNDEFKFDLETEKHLMVQYIYDELSELIESLPDNKIIFIGETPRVGGNFSPFDCMTTPIIQKSCSTTPMEKLSDWYELNLILKEKLSQLDILFVNPFDYLCDDNKCYNASQSNLYYSDDHHLSDFASKMIVGEFTDEFLEYINN